MAVLHIDVLTLPGAPGVEVNSWESGVLAYEVPRSEDAGSEILQLMSARAFSRTAAENVR